MSEPSKPVGDQGKDEPASGVARSWAASGEQTLLGVAPPIALPPLPSKAEPAPPAPPPPPRPASSGAIAATRVISVSDAGPVTPPAASPAPAASPVAPTSPAQDPEPEAARAVSVPAQPLAVRPASIGGWQSAGPAPAFQAPSLIETLTHMRSPLADAPPSIVEAAPTVPDATPLFDEPPPPPVPQASAPAPQVSPVGEAPAAPLPVSPPPAVAVAGAAVGGWQPVMHTVPIPIARKNEPPAPAAPPPVAETPEMFASTALSEDYLRAARDVVRAERDGARADAARATPAPAFAPAPPPAGDALANAATLQFEAVPPVRAPLSEQPQTSTSLPISVSMDSSWRRPEAPYSMTQPLGEQRATFPSWRVLVLVAISVLALIAIAAAAFVAVRRFAEVAPASGDAARVLPVPRAAQAAVDAAPAPLAASPEHGDLDDAALGARAARLVLLGRHDEARSLYAELAARSPGAPAYATLAKILARTRGLER